ncbi:UNVERIFIED_ORG: hypothetical protein GGE64_006626 [Rhizobium etli]
MSDIVEQLKKVRKLQSRRRCQNLSICNGQNESSMVSSLA